MFKKCFALLVIITCSFNFFSYGQTSQYTKQVDSEIIESLLESLLKDDDNEIDFSEIEEQLNYYLLNPIDLNAATFEDLAGLFFLSDLQIQEIIAHRNESGAYISIYELQSISSLDEANLQRLLPFVQVRTEKQVHSTKLRTASHDLMLRYGRVLEPQQGYLVKDKERSRYLGEPDHLLLRYRLRVKDKFQLAINMEKDPGEEFFVGSQRRGFDFYSASLYVQNIGSLRKLVLGDYSLTFGQGLSLWNGYSFGKGALVHNVARTGSGVRPHTSTNEVRYLRGIAGTLDIGPLELSPFLSYKPLDATLSSDSNAFSSLGSSGYHRTPAEIRNRESVNQLVYGMDLSYSSSQLKIGGTFVSTNYNKPRLPNQQLYNRFSFEGRQLINTSLYYHYTYKNVYLFGEGGMGSQNGIGVLNGLIASLSDQLSLAALYRHYQKNFYGFLNQPFSENSNANNERGLYTGLIWNPNRRMEWVAYADYFKFPWAKYRVDGPSDGVDLFSQFSYSPIRSDKFSIRYRYRKKQENSSDGNTVNLLENVIRHQLRLQAIYRINDNINLRNRAELITYKKGQRSLESGWMLYQDLIYKPMNKAISGNTRVAVFKTDGYNTRVYAFENNVLYAHSSVPYYNNGIRFYVNMRYRVNKKLNFWLRYASYLYKDKGIGSGLNYIDGRFKSDIRLQLRIQL